MVYTYVEHVQVPLEILIYVNIVCRRIFMRLWKIERYNNANNTYTQRPNKFRIIVIVDYIYYNML